jgi:hypothetical protein
MREFELFRLTVRHSERYGPIFALRMDMPEDALPDTPWLSYDERRAIRTPKPRISFYAFLSEFVERFESAPYPTHFADGFHKAEVCGDMWAFYDWEIPTRTCGRVDVAYRSVEIPRQVVRLFYRYARLKARHLKPDTDHEIDVPLARRERWLTRYGQGKGTVCVNVDDRMREKYDQAVGDPSFDDMLARLKQIAINTTRSMWQEASVFLSYDFAGFYFTVFTPDNKPTMRGGLIHHRPGKEAYAVELNAPAGAHWSIHT